MVTIDDSRAAIRRDALHVVPQFALLHAIDARFPHDDSPLLASLYEVLVGVTMSASTWWGGHSCAPSSAARASTEM